MGSRTAGGVDGGDGGNCGGGDGGDGDDGGGGGNDDMSRTISSPSSIGHGAARIGIE